MTRHYKRRWEESRGDRHDAWRASTWYFEVDDDGFPIRQIEVYDDGPVRKDGPEHREDEAGSLSPVSLFSGDGDWSQWSVSAAEFEHAWSDGSTQR